MRRVVVLCLLVLRNKAIAQEEYVGEIARYRKELQQVPWGKRDEVVEGRQCSGKSVVSLCNIMLAYVRISPMRTRI